MTLCDSQALIQFANFRKLLYYRQMVDKTEDYKTPGQLIQALLEDKGWTQRVLGIVLDVDGSTINKMASDTRPVDAPMALALGELFDVPAERFLDLQKSYDLAKARITVRSDPERAMRATLFGELPITEMIKRGWLRAESVRNVSEVENELARFFGVQFSNEIELLPHAAKKTMVNTEPTPAQLAWLYRVKVIANEMLVARYTPQSGRIAVEKLSSLLSAPEETRKVPRILAESGIRFVIAESLSSAKIDGVCMWLNDTSPVIGMTLRHDRIDNFWFVLRHELEHVLRQHGKTSIMLDAELEGEKAGTGVTVSEDERIANVAAANFCVPQDKMDGFILRKSPFFAERDIMGFARTLNIHSGLIAGQLQHKTGRYDLFRKHLVKIRSFIAPGAIVDGWGDIYPVDI